jgi:tRNA dimethylallyltransferase
LKISSGAGLGNTILRSECGKTIVPVLLGPTAVGKSAYALELAYLNGWEILSCDSRQIYRGMDIGTAKPESHELKKIKHWLIDIRDPSELYSAFDFASESLTLIRQRAADGIGVIICGGTGLYFKALSEGFNIKVETDPELKKALMERGMNNGAKILHDELKLSDPDAASVIHENDLQRIVRALAVYLQTGIPFSKSKKSGDAPPDLEFRTIILTMDRTLLYKNINQRVDQMIESGLVNECQTLLESGVASEAPGLQCVGYKELISYFEKKASLSDAVELIKQNSRRYAKRQSTWFSHQVSGIKVETGADLNFLNLMYTNDNADNIAKKSIV